MANVWSNPICPCCDKPVEEDAILVAPVNVTPKDCYESRQRGTGKVRPLFQKGGGRLYHRGCLAGRRMELKWSTP